MEGICLGAVLDSSLSSAMDSTSNALTPQRQDGEPAGLKKLLLQTANCKPDPKRNNEGSLTTATQYQGTTRLGSVGMTAVLF